MWPKERNFTGRDSYTRRVYLKYVINLAIMWLDQSDRGVNIPTPAHVKLPDSFPKESGARETIQ